MAVTNCKCFSVSVDALERAMGLDPGVIAMVEVDGDNTIKVSVPARADTGRLEAAMVGEAGSTKSAEDDPVALTMTLSQCERMLNSPLCANGMCALGGIFREMLEKAISAARHGVE